MAKTNTPPEGTAAEVVQVAMDAASVSMNALADATGIPYSTLRRKLRGQADFTLADLLLVAEALNTTPDRLLPQAFRGSSNSAVA